MNLYGLLDYQVEPAKALISSLRRFGVAIDGSDMGIGKTYQAGAAIRELDVATLVVCPRISMAGWRAMGRSLSVDFDIANYELLRLGTTPFGRWENPRPKNIQGAFHCTQCQRVYPFDSSHATLEPCPYHTLGIHCLAVKKAPHRHGKFLWHPAIRLLVFDEVHRCSAVKSLQADMLIAAKKQGIPTLGLSATLGENPLQFRALGYLLDLHKLANFYSWIQSHGCLKIPGLGGFQFAVGKENQKQIMARIHRKIFPDKGVRVRIKDLGDRFPDCQIRVELYDIDKTGRVNELYDQMTEAMAQLKHSAKDDKAPDHPLTKILRLRQEIELLKVPILYELTQDDLAQGKHVANFVSFRQSLDELCKRLNTQCRIDGSQVGDSGQRQRQTNVEDFQRDAQPVICATADAGGISIGLHDLHGDFPRVGNISPGYSAKIFRQLLGRLPRQGSKTKSFYRVLLIAGTYEEKIQRVLSSKLNCMDALQDADLCATNLRG